MDTIMDGDKEYTYHTDCYTERQQQLDYTLEGCAVPVLVERKLVSADVYRLFEIFSIFILGLHYNLFSKYFFFNS